MSRNLLEFRDYAKPRFVLNGDELRLTGTPVPRQEDILEWDWARPRIVDMFSLLSHAIKKASGIQKKEMETITTAILNDMIRAFTPLLSLHTSREAEKSPRELRKQMMKYLFSVCESNPKAKCFSTRPHFAQKIAKGERFKSGGHWDPSGHMVVAEGIKDFLLREVISPVTNP